MRKKGNLAIISIIILVAFLGVSLLIYHNFYQEKVDIYQRYLNVYKQLDQDVDTISVSSINHDVVFKISEDNNIRVDYYQKLDNSNDFMIIGKELVLTMKEKVDDVDSIFFSKTKELKTITIYLPADKNIYVEISSIDGSLSVDNLELKTCRFTTITGSCTISDSHVESIIVVNNSGDVDLNNCQSKLININNTTGATSIKAAIPLENYRINLLTSFGTLLVNGQEIYQKDQEGLLSVSNKYIVDPAGSVGSITIESTRGKINLDCPQ